MQLGGISDSPHDIDFSCDKERSTAPKQVNYRSINLYIILHIHNINIFLQVLPYFQNARRNEYVEKANWLKKEKIWLDLNNINPVRSMTDVIMTKLKGNQDEEKRNCRQRTSVGSASYQIEM